MPTAGATPGERHRLSGLAVLFTSDHHFGDRRARTFYRRPFPSVAEMDQAMIEDWNGAVQPDDEVWHLGDFALRQSTERVKFLLGALNGHKHLVVGNNDDDAVTECDEWLSVQAYAEMTIDGVRLVLCHYAFRAWRDMGKGTINLHGHSYGRLRPLPRQYDVGVDSWGFRPIKLVDLIARAQSRTVV
jgi:calcineurin-like phosphoesterase family protein